VEKADGARKPRESRPREIQVPRVGVHRQELAALPKNLGDRLRVSAPTERAIDDDGAGSHAEQFKRFVEQNGVVPRRWEVHYDNLLASAGLHGIMSSFGGCLPEWGRWGGRKAKNFLTTRFFSAIADFRIAETCAGRVLHLRKGICRKRYGEAGRVRAPSIAVEGPIPWDDSTVSRCVSCVPHDGGVQSAAAGTRLMR